MTEQGKRNIFTFHEAMNTMKENSLLKSIDIENIEKFLESSFSTTPNQHESMKIDPDFLKNTRIERTRLSALLLDESANPSALNQRIHDSLYAMQQIFSPAKNLKKTSAEEFPKNRDSVIYQGLNEATMGFKNSKADETYLMKELDKILQEIDISSDSDSLDLQNDEPLNHGAQNNGNIDEIFDNPELQRSMIGAVEEIINFTRENQKDELNLKQNDPGTQKVNPQNLSIQENVNIIEKQETLPQSSEIPEKIGKNSEKISEDVKGIDDKKIIKKRAKAVKRLCQIF